jgi:hypothetical protein
MTGNKRSKKYLAFISNCPCLLCGRIAPSEPHHIVEKGKGSMGMKTSDYRAVPLCNEHHSEYHNHGRQTFFNKYNFDPEYIIERLNQIYGDDDED